VVDVTEAYYDSDEADRFYFHVWGGEDIHIGIYEPGDGIRVASSRTVERMIARLGVLDESTRVLDLGAGYGGSARVIAKRFGAAVTCLNLSETQNARNRELCARQGLADRVTVVHGNFEALPFADGSFDVVWSQDAFLHSGRREHVLREAGRVLRSSGQLVFTDPMQADDCPTGVLGPVLARIHLESLASFAFYREAAARAGLEPVGAQDLSPQLGRHYAEVRRELERRRDEMVKLCTPAYVERMLTGLGHWIDAAARGHLAWGILHFRAA
jgi:sarcosine/dimethylglycine N-methyltransferase